MMGNFFNKEYWKDRSNSKNITKQNKIDHVQNQMYLKLLLLGAGDSGKSTIFKQVYQMYGKGYTESDLKRHKSLILGNISTGIVLLLKGLTNLGIKLQRRELEHRFIKFAEDSDLDPTLAEDIKMLWNDPGIKEVWEKRVEINFPYDNLDYYIDNIDRIAVGFKKYIPTFEDWVRCRITTTGITSTKFRLYNALFEMYDVGGQRSEREKWINCFDNVVTIIFVAGISGYDQVLYEKHDVNRMDEAIHVWSDVVNKDNFSDVGFVLFLNKYDLFLEKISTTLFRNEEKKLNLNYTGMEPSLVFGNQKEEAQNQCAQYIKDRFYDVTKPRIGYGLFACHFTTAISSEGMDAVFRKSQEQILKKHLMKNGFPVV